MINGLLGKKIGMTSLFDENGVVAPVTVVEIGPCKVVQLKTESNDGYSAVQIGYSDQKKRKQLKKPQEGHFKKAGVPYMKYLHEFKTDIPDEIKIGDEYTTDLFNEGEKVAVTGISKGKGFAGVMKRHGFKGFSATRGTHESFRGGGSIGQCADPGRVFKGKKMAGHMGNRTVTVSNLKIIKIIKDKNLLLVRGAVPGANGSIIEIRKRR